MPSVRARWLKWLEREFADRKVRGSNPTSASRLPLSRLGQPDSIPALVPPSVDMAARHRKGVTAERIPCLHPRPVSPLLGAVDIDISNIVPTETWGGLMQHIQLIKNIINGRFNQVPERMMVSCISSTNVEHQRRADQQTDGSLDTILTVPNVAHSMRLSTGLAASEDVDRLMWQGQLQLSLRILLRSVYVHVVQARYLQLPIDTGYATHVEVKVASRNDPSRLTTHCFQTKSVSDSSSPQFDETFCFDVSPIKRHSRIFIELYLTQN
ncbi:hypothetical protein CSKR_103473, partial [Clonorchis sinensis]